MSNVVEWRQEGAVVTLALNRPESHNAFTPEMMATLHELLAKAADRDDVRVIVLTGNGRSFCAGADLAFMRAAADYTFEQNVADGQAIFDLMRAVDECPKPVVGRINGAAIGGGTGLVSCCDIVVAVERATFGFSEVRLGIVPAVISPFVLAKIGPGNGRQYFLTGERFKATEARQMGLVHHVVADEAALDAKVAERVEQLLQAAPGAQAAAKALIRNVAYQEKTAVRTHTTVRAHTAELIAQRRASDEGKEGMSAFLEKRLPWWQE